MPLSPYFRNVRFVPKSFADDEMNWYFASPNSLGRVWPCSWFSSGFGSNVSRWLGPARHEEEDHDFAFGFRCAASAPAG
jgi:hypothetical protein